MQTTHSRMSAHGQPADVVAPGRRRRPRSPAHARGRPSQTAIRSRINTAVPCNDGGRPRMVPAPGGTTTALMHPGMTCHAFAWHAGAGGRWLGARAQAPFAVAATIARTDGVDGATPANRTGCPACVGRRTCPKPPALLHPRTRAAANISKRPTANRLSNTRSRKRSIARPFARRGKPLASAVPAPGRETLPAPGPGGPHPENGR